MCSLREIMSYLMAAITLLLSVIVLAGVALAVPAPGSLLPLAGAIAAAAAAQVAIRSLSSAFNRYRTCRDGAEAATNCSSTLSDGLIASVITLGGGVVGGLIAGLVAGIPIVGDAIGKNAIIAAMVAAGVVVGLLFALLTAILVYARCRDDAAAATAALQPIRDVDPIRVDAGAPR